MRFIGRGPILAIGVLLAGAGLADRVVRPLIIDGAEPLPAVYPIRPEGLASIVVSPAHMPAGMTMYQTFTGFAALRASEVVTETPPGFVDAILTQFDDDDEHLGDHQDRYSSLAAVFVTEEHAAHAFRLAVAHHRAPTGWGFMDEPARSGPNPDFGDEAAYYAWGEEYGDPRLSVYLWRVDNVLLHAVDFHPYDRRSEFLRRVAENMDKRVGR